ncbi:F-box protein SKIP23 [Prunus yedoensis var. nudiflora]|uniref:F-box protein SKIP23 n=1 Tax=Prunus yedoensis var. nudiflora TaxID=2094558 RepID=A0A314XLR0_PRUYE|nr:F-box protein SKIP23 [Prunus yedoensis var. nudiflora]
MAVFSLFQTSPFTRSVSVPHKPWHLRHHLGFHLSQRTVFLMGLPNFRNQTNPDRWLVKIEEDVPGRMHLLNPLSRFQLKPLPESFPKVLDLSKFWVYELGGEYVLHYVHFRPFGNGQFYAVDGTGRTVIVGLHSNLIVVANPVFGGDKKFLVESSGELLVVDMYLSMAAETDLDVDDEIIQLQFNGCLTERTVRFKVFRLDREGKRLVEMKSLGDRVLFLGDDCTFSASASELSGCKGNCIFFTDNFFYTSGEDEGVFKGRDIGVFDLDDGSIAPLSDYPEYSKLFWPPPDWIAPTQVQSQFEELAL